jgi:hypothetical protein
MVEVVEVAGIIDSFFVVLGLGAEGLQDHCGHLLHGFGRGVDHGKVMIAIHGLRLAQLVGALLE